MKTYKIFGLLFLVLLLGTFMPITNYKVSAEKSDTIRQEVKGKETNEKETKTKVKKTKKVKKTAKAKKAVSTKVVATTTTTKTNSYTLADLATHNSSKSCYTTINGQVYDLTSWISQHPGGRQAILSLCGKDGTQAFNDQHGGQSRPEQELKSFLIGKLN